MKEKHTSASCLGFSYSSLTQGRSQVSRYQAWEEMVLALAVLSTAAGANSVMGPECPPRGGPGGRTGTSALGYSTSTVLLRSTHSFRW